MVVRPFFFIFPLSLSSIRLGIFKLSHWKQGSSRTTHFPFLQEKYHAANTLKLVEEKLEGNIQISENQNESPAVTSLAGKIFSESFLLWEKLIQI